MAGLGSKPTSTARERLITAFLGCYAERPWEKIGVREVAEAAGYARGSFYRYFSGIEDLLRQVEAENTCTAVCRRIIETAAVIPLEHATDAMAAFYEDRVDAVAVLAAGSNGNNYLDAQRPPMKAMFAALLKRGFEMTPLELDVASEYIASAKVGMVRLWLQKRGGSGLTLNQVNKMSENLVESELWTFVARQAPLYGGPQPRKTLGTTPLNRYPWMRDDPER